MVPAGGALVTSPQGIEIVKARATILATGARERPRAARPIPGARPQGVYTTGQLQGWARVHLHRREVGRRAVVVGTELVSWSAVLTLRDAGCRALLMITSRARPESYAPVGFAGSALLRVPVETCRRVSRILGGERLEAVDIEDTRTGAIRTVECDCLVLTGDWIPDHELVRDAGLDLDPCSVPWSIQPCGPRSPVCSP